MSERAEPEAETVAADVEAARALAPAAAGPELSAAAAAAIRAGRLDPRALQALHGGVGNRALSRLVADAQAPAVVPPRPQPGPQAQPAPGRFRRLARRVRTLARETLEAPGLALTGCKGGSRVYQSPLESAVVQAKASEINELLKDVTRQSEVPGKVAELGDNAGHVLLKISNLTDSTFVRQVGASQAGKGALEAIARALRESDYKAWANPDDQTDPTGIMERDKARGVAKTIEDVLKETDDPLPGTGASAAEQADLDRLNKIVDADPHKKDYLAAGLKLPVKIHVPGRERDGGVYYSPGLPSQGKTTAPKVVGGPRPLMVYIELGKRVLYKDEDGSAHTDAFVQSALFHEFNHYRIYREEQDKSKDADARIQALKIEEGDGGPDNETEVISHQLGEDLSNLDDSEVKGVLRYWAQSWNNADQDFRDRAIAYLTAEGRPLADPKGAPRKRFLKLIKDARLDAAAKPAHKGAKPEDLNSLYKALGGT